MLAYKLPYNIYSLNNYSVINQQLCVKQVNTRDLVLTCLCLKRLRYQALT